MKKDIIIKRLFRNAEISYSLCDLSKCIGPVIDLVFIGKFIGTEGVTVIGYVAPLIIVMELIGSTIGNGAKAKVSHAIGAGDVEEAEEIFSSAVIFGTLLGVLLSVLTIIFCSGIVVLLGDNEPVTATMTAEYIYGFMIGVPFMTLGRILFPFLQMEGQYKRLAFNSFFLTAIDALGDAFVVFFLHGSMFEFGLATSVGYILSFAYLAIFFVVKKRKTIFRLSLRRFSLKNSIDIARLGSSSGTIKIGKALGRTLVNIMLTAMSVNYLVAACGVFTQIIGFIKSAWDAPADSLASFAGVFIGEEDKNSLKAVFQSYPEEATSYRKKSCLPSDWIHK